MSDEHQQQQTQQKSCKDNASTSGGNSSNNNNCTTQRKLNIHEMRNQDFVSRLMAATPPYLYSAPVGPNNFFFSDMLRSLVQARNNENARNLQLQQAIIARRPRKRSWSQQRPYYEQIRERKEAEAKQQLPNSGSNVMSTSEKPLELTNKSYFHLGQKYRKLDDTEVKGEGETKAFKATTKSSGELESVSTAGGGAVDNILQGTPPAASLPPQDLVLPPPPPMWYPPLYPPYGIDPLHFFIDLRVSGHIYDRKKENMSPLTSAENSNNPSSQEAEALSSGVSLPNKHRHGSAFTVPVPRSNELKNGGSITDAINLTAAQVAGNKFEQYAKYYDLGETKENHPLSKSCATNYMLQQLPRLYSQFAARDLIASNVNAVAAAAAEQQDMGSHNNNFDSDNKSEPDCDADSDGHISADDCIETRAERDIDVEIIDSIKYRTDGESSSRCSSADEASVTQID